MFTASEFTKIQRKIIADMEFFVCLFVYHIFAGKFLVVILIGLFEFEIYDFYLKSARYFHSE